MKIHSLNPRCNEKAYGFISIMFGSSDFSREYRELIGVVVSNINCCEYCINHYVEALNHYWKNEEKIQRLIRDY